MPKYGADYLRRLIDAVIAFEKAFERWMDSQVESDHMSARGLFPTVWAKEGEDETNVRALELAVAEAAGTAFISPQDVRTTAATVKGRLAALLADAEAEQTNDLPTFSPALMHSVVWAGAAVHWTSHQYRVAVREAAESLTVHWKQRLGRNDVDDTPFWQQTLSPGDPEPGRPKLTWPGDRDDKTTNSLTGARFG